MKAVLGRSIVTTACPNEGSEHKSDVLRQSSSFIIPSGMSEDPGKTLAQLFFENLPVYATEIPEAFYSCDHKDCSKIPNTLRLNDQRIGSLKISKRTDEKEYLTGFKVQLRMINDEWVSRESELHMTVEVNPKTDTTRAMETFSLVSEIEAGRNAHKQKARDARSRVSNRLFGRDITGPERL